MSNSAKSNCDTSSGPAPAPAPTLASASAILPAPACGRVNKLQSADSAVGGKVHEQVHAAIPPIFHQEEKKTVQQNEAGIQEVHDARKPVIRHTSSSAIAPTPPSAAVGAIAEHKHRRYELRETLSGSLWTLATSKSWKLVCEELPLQATAHKFSVVGKHNLQESLTKKGIQFHDEAMVFELCNAQIASSVLAEHLALSAVLPCRLSVTAKYGEVGCALHLFLPTNSLSNCFELGGKDAVDEPKKPYKFEDLAEHVTSTLKEIAKKAATK